MLRRISIATFLLMFCAVTAPLAADSTATAKPKPPATAKAAKTAPAKSSTAKAAPTTKTAAAATLVDINSASKADLAKLPAIGDVTADKIIAGRPFASKRDLVTKKIMTEGQYAKVKSLIIAKQHK